MARSVLNGPTSLFPFCSFLVCSVVLTSSAGVVTAVIIVPLTAPAHALTTNGLLSVPSMRLLISAYTDMLMHTSSGYATMGPATPLQSPRGPSRWSMCERTAGKDALGVTCARVLTTSKGMPTMTLETPPASPDMASIINDDLWKEPDDDLEPELLM
eukprot:CAMPEP_0119206634 /NCGR_PEP_ID=MMETSP1316-20130426/40487_1 /TAXON_ID=41880 /ORGANISM="Pycnococcus provasolii, Strain RCC2336" /LENGTH=156 /DNA_ID=CAMNT_0007203035 /DNA_START=70 /DNA_END=540 /DNA_ORIENTATION=-